MRDSKSLFLLVFALVLITISIVLVSVWGYNFYYRDKKINATEQIEKKPVALVQDSIIDSLQTHYDNSDSAEPPLENGDSSSVENINNKLLQSDSLKNAIAELQRNIDQLQNKNSEVIEENRRLDSQLAILIHKRQKVKYGTKKVIPENKDPLQQKIPLSITVFNLRLIGLEIKSGKAYQTSLASKTDKLVGLLDVKNNSDQLNSFQIEVMVVQPNGRVLQNAAWGSGNFDTPSGKRFYSVKFNFECPKGIVKTLNFSLADYKFLKGNYSMIVYHNGLKIAKLVKYLK
ncbi:MAG: hypothetical protein Q8891_07930 [Bacteroidota bacterium]|jgi:hypothetical protein|nr:hypothetical protein [Bacteroidota bacterium]